MAGIDPSIILGLKQQQYTQPDPIERYGKILGIQGAQGQQQMQEMQLQQARRGIEDEDATRAAFTAAGGDRQKTIDALMGRGLYKPAEAIRKAGLEEEKTRAGIDKDKALGGKAAWEVEKGKLEHGAAMLDLARDPASFEQVLRLGEIQGTFKPEVAAQLRQRGYSPELVKSLQQAGLTRAQQLEAEHRQATLAQTAATAPFTAGPNGPVANQPAQDFLLKKAATGAPKVTVPVNVTTEKKYGEQFAGKVAESDVALRDIASKAPDLADRANRVRTALAGGKVITGAGADARLAIGKALNLAGASDAEVIANTETLATSLAQNTLDAIKGSGLGSGSGFSNADRDFLEKAVGGKITLEAQTLSRLAALAHKAASKSAESWSKRVKEIPASALEGTGIRTDPVTVEPLAADAQPSRGDIDAELRRRGVIK